MAAAAIPTSPAEKGVYVQLWELTDPVAIVN